MKSRKRLARREHVLFLEDLSTEETAISRTCLGVVRCTCLFTSKVQSSVWAICTFLVGVFTCKYVDKLLTVHLEGDGEISFCGAIEMAGVITIKFEVIKGGMAKLGMHKDGTSPIFVP